MRAIKGGVAGDFFEEAITAAKLGNRALFKMLVKLKNQLDGFKYAVNDIFTFLSKIRINPSKYGMSCAFSLLLCFCLVHMYVKYIALFFLILTRFKGRESEMQWQWSMQRYS